MQKKKQTNTKEQHTKNKQTSETNIREKEI